MTTPLSVPRAVALYVGALLGPALLLLPGLAVVIAGPASVLAWGFLIGLSGLLAAMFTRLAVQRASAAGAAGYARAAFGARAGRVVAAWFCVGVVAGAPTVCLIGASYLTDLLGGGHRGTDLAAAALLAAVVLVTSLGLRLGTGVQLGLAAVLVVVVAVCVSGGAGHLTSRAWTPFAPHGWAAVGSATSVLMLSFVGWEAVAPLTGRLRRPRRDLPRVTATAFGLTTVIYLALAAVTVGALGPDGGGAVPLAELAGLALGHLGRVVAVTAAIVLTLGAVNAYLTGAIAMLDELRGPARRVTSGRLMTLLVAAAGIVLIGGDAARLVDVSTVIRVPTTLFVTVYLVTAASGVRLLGGRGRAAAAISTVAVAGVLCFAGWTVLVPVVVAAAVLAARRLAVRRCAASARRPG